jgi:ArsR family transcriptional regulator, arsenate/arsenite/antimonite-responsive transcriptional repressor
MDIDMIHDDEVVFSKALADETRQEIMRLTCCQWRSVNEIVAHLNVSQPTVSHHLAILRAAELVEVRAEGKQTFYRLNEEKIVRCCGNLMIKFAPGHETTETLKKCCM